MRTPCTSHSVHCSSRAPCVAQAAQAEQPFNDDDDDDYGEYGETTKLHIEVRAEHMPEYRLGDIYSECVCCVYMVLPGTPCSTSDWQVSPTERCALKISMANVEAMEDLQELVAEVWNRQ